MPVYVLIDDKKRGGGAKTYYQEDKAEFKELNEAGWGVYFAVNSFEASPDQLVNGKTKRNEEFLARLNCVYADLDIAKSGDGKTREEKEQLKLDVVSALIAKCSPNLIIGTSNGIQPLWKLKETVITVQSKKLYTKVIKGVIEWSKNYHCKADGVFDVARILRLPGYYHQKEEPFLCEVIHQDDSRIFSLEELEQFFPYQEPSVAVYKLEPKVKDNSNIVFKKIEEIDFQELMIRAFAAVGREASFDPTGRLILDGRLTGTFQGRKDDRGYLASSSHEPFKGNRVTAVADILGITSKESYRWITKEYGINYHELERQEVAQKQIEKIKDIPVKDNYPLRYTWGTRELDKSMAIIKRGNFILAAAKSNSGKTTFVFDMACKNAVLGHKVLFLSLEMEEQEIKDDFGRKYAGISIEEEFDYSIPENKQQAYQRKIEEIDSLENLKIKGVRRSGETGWEDIEEIIRQNGETDLVFVDNLDLISGQDRETDVDRQKRIVKSILNFTSLTKIPIVLIHHYRKSSSNGKDMGMDEISGSGKIRDGADRIIKITRNFDPMSSYPEKYKTTIFLQKGRGYPEASRAVYFIRGTFVDNPPPEFDFHGVKIRSDYSNPSNHLRLVVPDGKEEEETVSSNQKSLFSPEVISKPEKFPALSDDLRPLKKITTDPQELLKMLEMEKNRALGIN